MKKIVFTLLFFMMLATTFNKSFAAETEYVEISSINTGFTLDVAFWNNSGYDECIDENKNILGTNMVIKNNLGSEKIVKPYFALYENDKLLEVKILPVQTVAAGNEISYSESVRIPQNDTENYTAKVFVWENETLMPLGESISISESKNDFYGNNIATATFIQDLDKEIKGSMNTTNDTDYLKIIPTTTETYYFKAFSATGVTVTLYNSSETALVSNSSSFNYTLVANNLYYIKLSNSSTSGDYIFSITQNQSDEASEFNIYKYDDDINVYKNSIIKICNDLYSTDKNLSKQMYSEYEDILDDDAKLHALPDFLSEHPKDISNFDELINDYYKTKYDSFEEIKQLYIALIDKYTSDEATEINTIENQTGIISDEIISGIPIVGTFNIPVITKSETEEIPQQHDEQIELAAFPSLTIFQTTETTLTYDVTFRSEFDWGNTVYLLDFNGDDGLTTFKNVYGFDEYRTSGRYTISGLKPGGIYIVAIMWSTDGNNYGGENSIWRFVQLPNTMPESLSLYSGERISARIETDDIQLVAPSDFDDWLNKMDQAYYAYKELTGYTPYDSKKIEMRSTRQNLNEHANIADGYDYWEVVFGYYDYTSIFKHSRVFTQGHLRRLSQGDWGDTPLHELSHVFDSESWNFDAETLAQFKLYYIMEQLNAIIYRPDRYDSSREGWYIGENYYELLKYERYLDSYVKSFELDRYASEGFAAILIEIQQEIGWEPFKKTFRYFSSLSQSQIPYNSGDKLKLFLTKLKDYSGQDVLNMISDRDTEIIGAHFDITLEYIEPIYPEISDNGSVEGGFSEVTAGNGEYSVFQFTPTESANYYIYTSPYGGSGVSNDTFIEVYDNALLSGTPIASNDDYDGGRFSKVSVAMTDATTYYIKVRHYDNGQLHAQLNITKNAPVEELTLDTYKDTSVWYGESALYKFTPTKSITYVFEVKNLGSSAYADTYIKLYGNESMTQRIDYDYTKIIVNLSAGHTYYLQFSGYLMGRAKGRITVREGQTIEFTKSADSSFIYVNSPEYITRFDIVDDNSHIEVVKGREEPEPYRKIFEQENITGKNTYYQTHAVWWGGHPGIFEPTKNFYIDVDFYNPTDEDIDIFINNLVYGTEYRIMANYYNGYGITERITIPAGEHVLLFEALNAPLELTYPGKPINGNGWDWSRHRSPVILFDFEVDSGNVVLSSLAAHERNNLYLRNGYKNILNTTGEFTDSGEIIYTFSERTNEEDLHYKYKGIAQNQSAWIDVNIEFTIDDSTPSGQPLQVYLKDKAYPNGVANPKTWWMTHINPLNDKWDGILYGMPENQHRLTYHRDIGGIWNFAYDYHDTRDINVSTTGESPINNPVPETILINAALDVASGIKNHFPDEYDTATGENKGNSPDELSLGMGTWGATYHYIITVANTSNSEKTIDFQVKNFNNMIYGYKMANSNVYETNFVEDSGSEDEDWEELATVAVPPNETIVFEVVTNLACGHTGTNNRIFLH